MLGISMVLKLCLRRGLSTLPVATGLGAWSLPLGACDVINYQLVAAGYGGRASDLKQTSTPVT